MHWLVRGGNDFYDDENWKVAMRHAIASCSRMSEMKKCAYQLELFMGRWASMVWEMQYIGEATDEASRKLQAIHLRHRAIALAAELDHVGEPMIDQGRAQGLIVEVQDPDTPVGAKYGFANMDVQRGVSNYAMLRIIANRITWSTTTLLDGRADASLDLEHQMFCRMVWMCLPYTRKVSLMAAILFSDPLYISYEGARGEIKEYLLTWIIEVCQFRKRIPNDRDKVDQYLLSTALAATGRGKFNERSDFPYWEVRSSCLIE
jgi:hypothetical protein